MYSLPRVKNPGHVLHDMWPNNPAVVIISRVHCYMWESKRTGTMLKNFHIEQRIYTYVVEYNVQIYHCEAHVQNERS